MNNYSRYIFKAKRKDNREWVYGYYVSEFNKKLKINKYFILNDKEENFIEIIPETLCQCTGLKDIDGNYIFENDIVSFMEDGDISVGISPLNIKGIIEYLEGSYVVSQENTNNKYIDLMSYTINPSFKIIGNKFDKEDKYMSAREIFEKIGKIEEAWETIYEVKDKHKVVITYKYSDSVKTICVTYHFTQGFEIEGRFWLESINLITKGIQKIREELGWEE